MAVLHTRSKFITDLIPMILEINDHWWPRDLLRLARVSSAWLEPVRRILYASPSIHSFRACSQLARTLSDNPALLSLVKGVELHPMPEDNHEGRLLSSKERADLNSILRLEGLYCISLGGYLAIRAERFIHALGDTQLVQDLHIDGTLLAHSLISRPSLEWDESIAFRFPSLRTLHFTNIELYITYPSIPYELPLSNLVFDNVTITGGFLSYLLHETSSLQRLCIRSHKTSDFDEQIKVALASCTIQTLEYEVQTDLPLRFSLFDDGSPLPSLRRLILVGVQIDRDALTSVSQKCRNLEELAIGGRMVTVAPCEWITVMRTGWFPSLRYIGLPWGTNYPPFTQWCNTARDAILEAAALYEIHVWPKVR